MCPISSYRVIRRFPDDDSDVSHSSDVGRKETKDLTLSSYTKQFSILS